jgi:hypothetical protein
MEGDYHLACHPVYYVRPSRPRSHSAMQRSVTSETVASGQNKETYYKCLRYKTVVVAYQAGANPRQDRWRVHQREDSRTPTPKYSTRGSALPRSRPCWIWLRHHKGFEVAFHEGSLTVGTAIGPRQALTRLYVHFQKVEHSTRTRKYVVEFLGVVLVTF